ncbi:MAG TPA: YhbY family RNA-binding protein [Leucothrix sp.]|nr:YhbY family RNA-binding protein [Leucothrix sp.]
MDKSQIKQLKALAHKLKPIVTVGQHGMKDSINDELAIAIDFHQLVKVKINLGDRDARDALVDVLAKTHKAELVQKIGNVAVFYKRNFDKENLLKKT